MLDGHFDYGNGYHGRVYLNPHQLFRHPSTIWRFAQDLIDLLPGELVQRDRSRRRAGDRRRAARAHDRRPARQPPQPDASAVQLRAVQLRPGGRLRAARLLSRRARGKRVLLPTTCGTPARRSRAARRSCKDAGGDGRRDGRDLRSLEADRRPRRAEHRARRISRRRRTTRPASVRCARRGVPITRF